jgi:hypothetical protein
MGAGHFWTTLLSAVYGTSCFVSVVIEVAFVAVVATVVRRHRPDVFNPWIVWAIASLVWGVLGPMIDIILPMVASPDGIDSVLRVRAISSGFGIVVHVAMAVLLLRGLVALAQPPKPIKVEGAPPYR